MRQVAKWTGPPAMESGAPEPVSRQLGDTIWVAYRCKNPDFKGWDVPPDDPGLDEYFAIIRFDGVSRFSMGPPSDEMLHTHPLKSEGLEFYEFHEAAEDDVVGRWIVTFHDETLDVYAEAASVETAKVDAASAAEALNAILGSAP